MSTSSSNPESSSGQNLRNFRVPSSLPAERVAMYEEALRNLEAGLDMDGTPLDGKPNAEQPTMSFLSRLRKLFRPDYK